MSDLPFLGDLDTGSYRFEDPWLLLAALILPALILVRLVRRPSQEGLGFSRVDAIKRVGGFRRRMRWLPFALRLAAIALLVVAVARPQRGQANASVDAEGIDIALALDISSSMNETDFEQRSRLEVAQDVLRQFVDHQRDDRIGLVAFQEEARVLSPLTLDHDPLVRLI
ncbi:MAG TPA: BatA domain-containing protein, partial [Dehalococcoidia bacterium]|nr:BatA domain-containing protein [Dehalococcoidia bacterium]